MNAIIKVFRAHGVNNFSQISLLDNAKLARLYDDLKKADMPLASEIVHQARIKRYILGQWTVVSKKMTNKTP